MKTALTKLFLLSVFFFPAHFSQAQGCSDAGFCTLNSFKPNHAGNISKKHNQLKFGASWGDADLSISAWGNYIEYTRQLNNKIGIDVRLASLAQNGNGIAEFGLSDVYLNAHYRVGQKGSLTLGTKLPLSDGNKMTNNLALPMDYQASLGTVDLILGVGFEFSKIQLVTALQQPITQNNNQFIAENFPMNSKLRAFQSTNKYKRKGDMLLRVSYPLKFGSQLKITPSLLPIYHLGNDRYTDAMGNEKEITGSKGLTLNSNIYLDYEFNQKNGLQLSIGAPLVTRDSRPDGLTRGFVIAMEYSIRF